MSSRRHRLPGLLAGCALTLGLLAGCGSSNSSKAGTVTADSYVGQVCTSIASWYRNLQAHGTTLNSQLGPRTSGTDGKRALETYLGDSLGDTETATSALRGAGVPDVSDGASISGEMVSAFEHAVSTLRELQPKVSALSTADSAAVLAEAKHLTETVQGLPLNVGTGLGALSKGSGGKELDKAASQSQTCKNVGARSAG